jgi:hypothetical protein
VKDILNLTASTESDPMAFVKDLLHKRLGLQLETRRIRVEVETEFLGHENSL